MKTKLDITKILDDYTDNEFFVEGEQTVDTEKAVSDLLGQMKQKKRMKPLFKVLIAAAAAVSLFAIVGFTYLTYEFSVLGGKASLSQQGNSTVFTLKFPDKLLHPVRLKEDRIIFTYDDEETDITELIDEETPFIYSYAHPDTGWDCYVIAGGTAEDFGYAVIYYLGESLKFEVIGVKYTDPDYGWRAEEAWFNLYDKGEIDYDTWRQGQFERKFRKWFTSACEKLGYSCEDFSGFTMLDDFDSDISGTTHISSITKN